MAEFKPALDLVLRNEGGYAKVSGDAGGETYRGISRRYNPNWEGWRRVDMHQPLPNGKLIHDAVLDEMVSTYYYNQYWLRSGVFRIWNQALANAVFDWYITSGDDAVKSLQRIVGVKDDGDLGQITAAAVNAATTEQVFGMLRDSRIVFYKRLAERSKSQVKFLKGWLRRVAEIQYS